MSLELRGPGGPLTVRSEFSSIDGDCRQGSRLQGGLRGRRLDDAGVFQGVLDTRCMGPRDANWR